MQAIEKISTVEQVEERIKEYILSDSVQIGDKLPAEKQLCEELDVGRGTIREALRLLQAKGYVEIQKNRGSFVSQKEEMGTQGLAKWFKENEIELKDFIEVRMAIEPMAVRIAASKCTKKEIERLRKIHQDSIVAAAENNIAELALCDEKFHACMVESCHNKLISSINKEISCSLKKFRVRTFRIETNVENFIPAHAAILEAFQNQNAELAEKSIIDHLNCVYEDLENSTKMLQY